MKQNIHHGDLKDIDPEHLHIHCPALGGTVPFSYCISPSQDLPCHKTFDCWWQTFDILHYVEERFPPELLTMVYNSRPSDKVSTILELLSNLRK